MGLTSRPSLVTEFELEGVAAACTAYRDSVNTSSSSGSTGRPRAHRLRLAAAVVAHALGLNVQAVRVNLKVKQLTIPSRRCYYCSSLSASLHSLA